MVVDTGIVIEHLRAKDKSVTTLSRFFDAPELFISAVSIYELYMGATSNTKENDIAAAIAKIDILPFDNLVAISAAQLYNKLKQKNQLIEFRDIFIAATCIVNEMPLLTLNKKHFNRIDSLKIID